MDKKEQEKLITEIMDADAKDGLYEPTISKMETTQTAVEWFFDNLKNHEIQAEHFELYQQAKQMEKEQILDAIINNQNGLLRRKTVLEAEQYYNETYNK